MIYKGYIIHYCFCGYKTKMYLINFPNIPTFPKNIKYAHKTIKEAKRYKEIEALEKSIWNTPIHELLELTITETPLDGRTRYAKQLPVYNVGVLAELTY